MVNLKLAICDLKAVLELRLPDGLVHLLEPLEVVFHHFCLVLFVHQRVHCLGCVVGNTDNVFV